MIVAPSVEVSADDVIFGSVTLLLAFGGMAALFVLTVAILRAMAK